MSAPLPSALQVKDRPQCANTGLWYDKFCDKWDANWKIEAPAKLEWIQTVTSGRCGNTNQLKEHTERIQKLAENLGGAARVFSSLYRFASGLGREHPIENGFVWHHTLGTPFLPGSSVKGMVRAYLTTWTETNPAEIKRIFGPSVWKDEQKCWHDTEHSVGTVVFLDAIPTAPVPLKADVMTPHYDPYYQKGEVPGDWHSPIPIPFLTVGEGAKFLFTVLPRTRKEQHVTDCNQVMKWLEEALQETGAGAKTAVGYGRFKVASPSTGGNSTPATPPILAEIEQATPQTMESTVKKAEKIEDKILQKEAAVKIMEKTKGGDFRNIRKKAETNPNHWLNTARKLAQ